MPDNPVDQEIKKRLSEIYPDEMTAAKVADLVAHNRPKGWGKRSNTPYYRPIYGEWIRTQVDRMILTKQDIIFRYSVFCGDAEEKMSHATLYNQVYQSLKYLLEQLDPIQKYSAWHEVVETKREKGLGVTIRYIKAYRMVISGESMPQPDFVEPKEDIPTWKYKMELWLESTEVRPFIAEGLALNELEILDLKKELNLLDGIQASVTSSAVKIIRVNL